jgi:hypothetical protein
MEKNWRTCNAHTKQALFVYCFAISMQEIKQTQIDHLLDKDLLFITTNHPKSRVSRSIYALTDLGVETVKHYWPKEMALFNK